MDNMLSCHFLTLFFFSPPSLSLVMNGVKKRKKRDLGALIKEHLPLEQIMFRAALDKGLLEDKWKSIPGFFKVNKK